jgi:GNAT superfamily N-acetyltransferase
VPIEIAILGPGDGALLRERVAPGVFDDPIDPGAAAHLLADPRHHLAAALDDGTLVGFASGIHYLHPDVPAPELWIDEVGVAESHRGQGIGRALVGALLGHGRRLGCSEAWVVTHRGNRAAQRLYAACGGTREREGSVIYAFRLDDPAPAGGEADSDPLPVRVRPATPADADDWLRMRHALLPDGSEAEHREEIAVYFDRRASEPQEVLLAHDERGRPVGLAELSLRPCAEGCTTSPVAYLEGWYVAPEARRRGVGHHLVAAAEDWARRHGCRELASDTSPANTVSAAAHLAAGFEDAGLVRCFRKGVRGG